MTVPRLSLGYSPCPNDTFIFHALSEGLLDEMPARIKTELHDVETLNQMAFETRLDITKLSFFAYLKCQADYRLLSSGAALGYGCGPVVVAKKALTEADMATARVVLPGRWTTAHLLFRLWMPSAGDRHFVPYDHIFEALESGEADAGVIIHESRFTFESAGFSAVADLGAWWEAETGLPIPLGCIAARRRLPGDLIAAVDAAIGRSLDHARQQPESVMPRVRRYAQEMADHVLKAHIDTFVNDFSRELGTMGHAAIRRLEVMARERGILA
ncbi:MAG: 1,4-dihydroxy-6-naphthoate synthase [Desulfosarcinaceae bacterium]|nr:1,4-dihydroxy-6-naphthoate synthase [Desulfosarcinaceae bacterium]